MSKMHIKYNGDLNSVLVHEKSGTQITTDAPVDNNGLGNSFSPTDLTTSSLAACMITVLGIHDKKNGWGITGMQASIEKTMANSPRKISKIEVNLEIQIEERSDETLEQIKDVARNCPVAHSLDSGIEQKVNFTFT